MLVQICLLFFSILHFLYAIFLSVFVRPSLSSPFIFLIFLLPPLTYLHIYISDISTYLLSIFPSLSLHPPHTPNLSSPYLPLTIPSPPSQPPHLSSLHHPLTPHSSPTLSISLFSIFPLFPFISPPFPSSSFHLPSLSPHSPLILPSTCLLSIFPSLPFHPHALLIPRLPIFPPLSLHPLLSLHLSSLHLPLTPASSPNLCILFSPSSPKSVFISRPSHPSSFHLPLNPFISLSPSIYLRSILPSLSLHPPARLLFCSLKSTSLV